MNLVTRIQNFMHFTSRPAERYLKPRHLCYLRVIFYYWFFFFLVAVVNICPGSGSVKVIFFLNNSLLKNVFSKNRTTTRTLLDETPTVTLIPTLRPTSALALLRQRLYRTSEASLKLSHVYYNFTCSTQTDNHFTTNRRTDREPTSMQDQMLRLPGHLHWWNRQKP